jgi:hypothetical protein
MATASQGLQTAGLPRARRIGFELWELLDYVYADYSAATWLSSPAATISRRSDSGAMSKPFGQVT